MSLSPLISLLSSALTSMPSEEEFIEHGYDEMLDYYRELAKGGKQQLAEICEREKKNHGLPHLKIKYNGIFGYFFELPSSQKDNAPAHFIRKQTLANAERFVTEELKAFENDVLMAQQKMKARQDDIWQELQEKILQSLSEIKTLSHLVANADIIQGFATAAEKRKLCKPKIVTHSRNLLIENGRHLTVETALEKQKKRFMPNSLEMKNNESFHLITGPNMAGKSTFLRQNAIIIFLAHLGCFVPAQKAEIPIMDAIFTRIGSGDSLTTGESTFLVEMQETARILRYATEHSFLVLDEIGRGTSTYDGLSLAWSIMEYLHEKKCKTLFATHYHELITLAEKLKNAKNFSARILEDPVHGIIFLHQIFEGGAEKSFGIEVGKLAGLPTSVIQKAEHILKMLERQYITEKKQNKKQGSLFSLEEIEESQEYAPVSKEIQSKKKSESKLEQQLKNINPNEITPMQALEMINNWKKNIDKENDFYNN